MACFRIFIRCGISNCYDASSLAQPNVDIECLFPEAAMILFIQRTKFELVSDISSFSSIDSLGNLASLKCGGVPGWGHLILWPSIAMIVTLYEICYSQFFGDGLVGGIRSQSGS
jgi:hypothetical protein